MRFPWTLLKKLKKPKKPKKTKKSGKNSQMTILAVSNDVSDWSSDSGVTTNTARFDNTRVPYAMTIPNNTLVVYGNHAAPAGDIVWYHYRLRTNSDWGGADDGMHVRIKDANDDTVAIIDVLNGTIIAKAVGDSTVSGAASSAPGFGVYINMDIKVEVNASNIIVSLYRNQSLASTATAANTSGGKGVARFFSFDQVDVVQCWFSEFIVADADTQGMRLSRLSPTAVGNYSQWSGGVADINDDDAGSGITQDTAAQRQSVEFASYSLGNAIAAVVVASKASTTGSAPTGIKNFLRIGTTDYDGATKTLGEVQANFVEEYLLDPSDSSAWDSTKINACEVGVLSVA